MLDFLFALVAVASQSTGGGMPSADAGAVSPPSVETAVAETGQSAPSPATSEESPSVIIGENTVIGQGVASGGVGLASGTDQVIAPDVAAPSEDAIPPDVVINRAVIPEGLIAEEQTPTGKFTTAAEVRPILGATKGSWVAVREYDGKDLLYVTHLWSWRCGLAAMAISVNGEPMQNWPLPECHMKYGAPNAILEEDGLPYLSLRLGGVETITIQVVYDDLSVDLATFERSNVLIP